MTLEWIIIIQKITVENIDMIFPKKSLFWISIIDGWIIPKQNDNKTN